MELAHPLLLLLLPVAAAAVAWSLRGRGYSRRQAAALGALRGVLAAAAVFAAAQTSVVLPSPRRTVVLLADTSPSVVHRGGQPDALAEDARRLIDHLETAEPDAQVVLFGFDALPHRLDDAAQLRRLRASPVAATDIAAALDAARAAVPSDRPGVVVLLSDGLQTRGDAASAALQLRARGIPIDVIPQAQAFTADVRAAKLHVPQRVAAKQPFVVSARIESTRPVLATVTLARDDNALFTREVEVSPDRPATVESVQTLTAEGVHVFSVDATCIDDAIRQDNRLAGAVRIEGPPIVLYLTGFTGSTPVEQLLAGIPTLRVRQLKAGDDLTPAALAGASAVVLDNFPAKQLNGAARRLAAWVEDAGGALMMIGGPGSFGAGGYIDTPVDRVLPVHSDPRNADKTPLALVVCLDASGSMGEGGAVKMRLAREAALQTLATLTPRDAAAVIAFRVRPEVVIPLGPAAAPDVLARRLQTISPAGGTDLFAALNAALPMLARRDEPLRHVVLLSDGNSLPGDADAVIARYRAAKVSISTLATGADADRTLLKKLADETGGRFYDARNIRDLPQLLLDDLRRIEGPLVRKGDFAVEAAATGGPLKGLDLSRLPHLASYNRTRLKERASAWLIHREDGVDEPILATGRAGLGRTTALTASFDRAWAGTFAAWEQTPRLLASTLHAIMPAQLQKTFALWVERDGDRFHLEAAGPTSAGQLRVKLADLSTGTSAELALQRTAATRWRASTEARFEGPVEATLIEVPASPSGSGTGGRVLARRLVGASYPREYREFTPRLDLLGRLASMTGGKLLRGGEVSAALTPRARELRDLTSWLAMLVLVLFLGEMAARAGGWV